MKYINLIAVLIVAATFTSCGSSSSEDKTTTESDTTTNPTTTLPAPNTAADTATIKPVQLQPANTPQQITTVPANTPPVVTKQGAVPVQVATGAGLNPEHGKPGHRCDIQVGAPLNSPATAQPAMTNATKPTLQLPQPVKINPVTTTAPATANGVTAPGMNPEHGKPGHRCDIAVGAPLSTPAPALPAK